MEAAEAEAASSHLHRHQHRSRVALALALEAVEACQVELALGLHLPWVRRWVRQGAAAAAAEVVQDIPALLLPVPVSEASCQDEAALAC